MVLRDVQLLQLDAGIFVLHAILTTVFVALPVILLKEQGLAGVLHWKVYLPVLLVAFALMAPAIMVAERKKQGRPVFLTAVALLGIALLWLALSRASWWSLITALLLFFVAFNVLEALLPSLVSKAAPAQSRGTAMGVYATSQFLGAFAGGAWGGWCYGMWGANGVLLGCACLAFLWMLAAGSIKGFAGVRDSAAA
jgi:MFS family permease